MRNGRVYGKPPATDDKHQILIENDTNTAKRSLNPSKAEEITKHTW